MAHSKKKSVLIVGNDLIIPDIDRIRERNEAEVLEILGEVELLLKGKGSSGTEALKDHFEQVAAESIPDPDVKVSDLADRMNLSVSSLGRWCGRVYGISPMKYVYNLRLERASLLLSLNHRRIKDVAYETGFSSLSYFSKCYREKFGVPPRTARMLLPVGERIKNTTFS
jgi:transcriptional regulator GlxA family with amidase domain